MKILADASLPLLNNAFPTPFILDCYHEAHDIPLFFNQHEWLLCRSTLTINDALLKQLPGLKGIMTASSGTDHIDISALEKRHITLFDAKGANAQAVTDYVMATLAYLEKNHLLTGHKITIVGMGFVGKSVYERLTALNFNVSGYDPYLNDEATSLDILAAQSNIITLHANLHDAPPYPSRNLINKAFLSRLQPGTVIINAARGGLVNEADWMAVSDRIILCTDVFENEPTINAAIVAKATLCTPHIAGHSIEAKNGAIQLLSQKLYSYYHLPYPKTATLKNQNLSLSPTHWVNETLEHYNPSIESNLLKTNVDLTKTFKSLRSAHQFRHEIELKTNG